jgi:ribonuclease HI
MSCLDEELTTEQTPGNPEPTLDELLDSETDIWTQGDSTEAGLTDDDTTDNFDHNLLNILRYSPLSYIHSQTALPELESLTINHSRTPDAVECQVSHALFLDQVTALAPDIELIPEHTIKVFCDGGFNSQSKEGSYGSLGIGNNGTLWETSKGFYPIFSAFGAELKAFRHSLNKLFHAPRDTKEAWIFTDSQGLVQTLTGIWRSNAQTGEELLETLYLIGQLQESLHIRIRWIPGHSGLLGNEMAHTLATKGLRSRLKTTTIVGADAFRGAGRALIASEQEAWKLPNRAVMKLGAKERRFIFRIATGYGEVNHWKHKKDPGLPASCRFCPAAQETVAHLIQECPHPQVQQIRQAIFPASPLPPSKTPGSGAPPGTSSNASE